MSAAFNGAFTVVYKQVTDLLLIDLTMVFFGKQKRPCKYLEEYFFCLGKYDVTIIVVVAFTKFLC